jgi:hypothetical protein
MTNGNKKGPQSSTLAALDVNDLLSSDRRLTCIHSIASLSIPTLIKLIRPHTPAPPVRGTARKGGISGLKSPHLRCFFYAAYSSSLLAANMQRLPERQRIVGYIFRAWITIKGEKRYAKDYGHKAWRIPIYR